MKYLMCIVSGFIVFAVAKGLSPLQDNLLNVALKLNVPPVVMREAVFRVDDDRVQNLADSYEKLFDNTLLPITRSPTLLNISCSGNRECDLCNAVTQEMIGNSYCVSLGVFQIAPWNV